MELVNKKTGEKISADMFFINKYSDGGTVSLKTLLDSIKEDFDII